MWELLQQIYTDMLSAGFPVESIVVALLTIASVVGTWRVIRYMMRSKKEILNGQVEVAKMLEKLNNSITTSNMLQTDLVTISSNIVYRLETLEGNSNNINELQALTFAELLVEESFNTMLRVYYETRNWLDEKKPVDASKDDALNARTIDRIATAFDAIQRDYINKLGIYAINNKKLDGYINDEFRREWNHILTEVTNRLIIDQNSMKEYLKVKEEIFKSDLYKYIRSL